MSSTEAGALIVIDVETLSSGIWSNAVRMSSIVSMATPVRPTSPRQRGSSESRPSCVGRSKAMDRPVPPARAVGVEPQLRGRVEGNGQAGPAVGEQVAVALVGLLRRRVARVLAH